jgi:uncharacterized protein
MKLLVVLLVVLFGLWLWRQGRQAHLKERDEDRKATKPRAKPPIALPAEMVRCSVCGLHLPAADALTTGKGSFCSPEHQRQAEHH